MLAMLAACGDTANTSVITPTTQSGTVAANTPGMGPTVIASVAVSVVAPDVDTPTSTTQGNAPKQVITFADRTLTIGPVSKQAGSDASSTGISLTITIANTSKALIMNEATFYQLEAAEGDSFGTQSSVSANFYGSIAPNGSRRGTIVFQAPTGAVSGIHLLFRPEVATDTALIPLNL